MKKGHQYDPIVWKKFNSHPKKVMIWGCFATHELGDIYRVEGTMDPIQYIDILKEVLIPSARKIFNGAPFFFQQDGASPIHPS